MSKRVYFVTVCNSAGVGCGWVDNVRYLFVGDCYVTRCPRCGSDRIVDNRVAV